MTFYGVKNIFSLQMLGIHFLSDYFSFIITAIHNLNVNPLGIVLFYAQP